MASLLESLLDCHTFRLNIIFHFNRIAVARLKLLAATKSVLHIRAACHECRGKNDANTAPFRNIKQGKVRAAIIKRKQELYRRSVFRGHSVKFFKLYIVDIFGCDFYQSKELSYNLWCIVFAIGFALQYGISTYLCVREKIYICMVWIVLGVALQCKFKTFFTSNVK